MSWTGINPFFAKCQATESRNDPSWPRCPIIAIVDGGLQLAACELLIKWVNGKLTPHPKIIIMGLCKLFWVYISHKILIKPF